MICTLKGNAKAKFILPIYAWNASFRFTHERSVPCVEKLTTSARIQLHTSSKGDVDIDLNFPRAVTKQMEVNAEAMIKKTF